MKVIKAGNQECKLKTYEDNKSSYYKSETAQWKNDKRKIDEERLQLYVLVKRNRKLMNQVSNFKEF